MSKKKLFGLIVVNDEDSTVVAMRKAIERSRKAEEGCQDFSSLDFHSDFDDLEIPVVKKPLFPFGEKALSKIAGVVRRSPSVH